MVENHSPPLNSQNVQELIAEYRKPLVHSNPNLPRGSIEEIQTHLKAEIDKFDSFKRESNTFYTSALSRLEQVRKKYCGSNAARELGNMINSIDC